MTEPDCQRPATPLVRILIDAARPASEALAKMGDALEPLARALAEACGRAEKRRRAEARLLTEMYSYPDPSPSWLRTTSRRRRAGSRRLKRMLRRHGADRLHCW